MRSWIWLFLYVLLLPSCSDLGSEEHPGWVHYDLPHGQISLPAELQAREGTGALPTNPEFRRIVGDQTLAVQFYLYSSLEMMPELGSYVEDTFVLHGCKVVFIRGLGVFDPYEAQFSTIIGARASFEKDAEPVVVAVAIKTPEGERLAREILMTLRPRYSAR